MEAIKRLSFHAGLTTVERIVDVIHADWLADQPKQDEPLLPDHYRLHVVYNHTPSIDELKEEFGEDGLTETMLEVLLAIQSFTLHASCMGMKREAGEVTFFAHEVGQDWVPEEQIAWGAEQRNAFAPNGYRPATHEEILAFVKARPDVTDCVGLGSFTIRAGSRCSTMLMRGNGGQCRLDIRWIDGGWSSKTRVLFVSK